MSIDEWTNQVHEGDGGETLRRIPESSVHCVMTSPPYYGLRDYGVEGQIGLEDNLDKYIERIADIGDELARVLRPDGSWWLNLGDSFASSPGGHPGGSSLWGGQPTGRRRDDSKLPFTRKQKMLVPHRVAIELQNRGWIVRNDVVWVKPNSMPESVQDRLAQKFEFVFHLVRDQTYFYDLDAIRERHAESSLERSGRHDNAPRGYPGNDHTLDPEKFCHPNGKNPGDIFEVGTQPFPEAHFAVYPPALCETPIKATCPPKVCTECGAPYHRDVEDVQVWEIEDPERPQLRRALELAEQHDLTRQHLVACRALGFSDAAAGQEQTGAGRNTGRVKELAAEAKEVLGGYFREFTTVYQRAGDYSKVCGCDTNDVGRGIVLDPFAGAGTTLRVAKDLGRRFIGIELNPKYVAMAQKRVGIDVDDPSLLTDKQQATLADGGFVQDAEPGGGQ